MGIVDVTAGQDQVSLWMPAAQPMHQGAQLAVCLGSDGAAVDDANIGALVAIGDGEAGARQPVAQLGHLGKVHLAAERLQRDVHGCWTRIAAATIGARRARRMRGPRLTAMAACSRNAASSASVQPPSGPTAIA